MRSPRVIVIQNLKKVKNKMLKDKNYPAEWLYRLGEFSTFIFICMVFYLWLVVGSIAENAPM